ncbi:DUF7948 domain-containing protein [Dyadobacter diqingensis]|uniref:DUF7948 domain-containing protein n=1 Tax=Dyadobacter diqingensis TaxID=2938121 RepID=UPI0020C1A8F4|nr:T9SS type A sorting domain-containing protein [Dyadobacter diqingensis]
MIRNYLLTIFILCWTTAASFSQKRTTSSPFHSPPGKPTVPAALKDKTSEWLKKDNEGFIENKGQIVDETGKPNKAVKYLLNMQGLNVQLRKSGFSYDTYVAKNKKGSKPSSTKGSALHFHRVDIDLEGANTHALIVPEKQVGDVTNVYNELGQFQGIRSFGKVTYKDIYPGIDLEFVASKGTDKPVEYNFIVHPGADASLIKLKYNSGSDIALKNGKIEMQLAFGKLSESIPASWIKQSGKNMAVRYKTERPDLFAFNVPAYDKTKTLVIDPTPTVLWATYYGGSDSDLVYSVNSDPAGNIYVTGSTFSTSGIATASPAHQVSFSGPSGFTDAFVAKFNNAGVRQWGTYYGGNGTTDSGYDLVSDGTAVYLAGNTSTSTAGLIGAGGHQNTLGGGSDGMLVKFNASNGSRLWGTYYGGAGFEQFNSVILTADGGIIAAGSSASANGANIIATPGALKTIMSGSTQNGMAVKFNAAGVRQWGTYFGGNVSDMITSLDVDATGNIYLAGLTTSSTGIASSGAFQATLAGNQDGFIAKMNSTGSSLLWSTYFGSTVTAGETLAGIKVDHAGDVVVVGEMWGGGLATPGSFQPNWTASSDWIIAKFNPAGARQWATYFGAAGQEGLNTFGTPLDIDENNNIFVTGGTAGSPLSSLTSACSFQTTKLSGNTDMLTLKLSADGSSRLWATYFGGAGIDNAYGIKYLGNKTLMVVGTASTAGLATAGAHQTTPGSTSEGMIVKFKEDYLSEDFITNASTLSPMTQNACILGIPQLITGNATGVLTPSDYVNKVFYQWQESDNAAGPWTDLPGETFKDLQPPASQTTKYYRRLSKVNTSYCNLLTVDAATSPVTSVVIGTSASPIANADGPLWYVCASPNNTVTLNGSATGGAGSFTYEWFAGSATTAVATTADYTPTATSATTYTLKVTDAAGCSDIDQVTVTPAVASAGADKSNCAGAGVQIGTAPVSSPNVVYSWTLSTGASASSTLSCTSCAQPVANPLVATTYRLTVTVTRKGGATCSSTDDVVVTPVSAPNGTAAFAGPDQTICKNSTVTLGGTNDATFAYTWTSGQYLSNSQIFNPVFSAGTSAVQCAMNYTVTAVKTGCSFVDQVKVSVINPAITFQNETKCGPIWIDQNDNNLTTWENCDEAVYTWSVVSGNGVVLSTRAGGSSGYLKSNSGITQFRRTTTLNGISCSADVFITSCTAGGPVCDFKISMIGEQGCPKVFPAFPSFQLMTDLPASDYNFTWSPANMVDDPHAAVVTVTSAVNTPITCTVTNKYDASITCSKTKLVNNPQWSLPIFNAQDKYTCPGTSITIGDVANAGFTYNWTFVNETPATGLSSATISNPLATVSATTPYKVKVTETATECISQNLVTVFVTEVTADAGNDRAVCNGGTITLGTPPPVGTNFTYSWTPVNAAWAPGSGPNDAQPQVLFASASQTFNLTVTDPISGCSKTDAVTLRSTISAGEYAGAAISACPEENVQLGRQAEPFATYEWTMQDGSPAIGLSCTNCANPSLLAPDATAIYKVKVSYPGCSLPMEDLVTVTVKTAPAIALIDKSFCPTGSVNIGFGSAGNPAAPANVSAYLWSPATGLNNATIADPATSVKVETTYNVQVTYNNGCVRMDQVKVTPLASANAGPDVTVCLGESLVIGSAAIAGLTYSWSGAGIVSGANTAQPTVKPTATTTYTVTVSNGVCIITDDVTVIVNSPAAFNITGNTSICEGGFSTVGLTAAAPGNTSWQWSPLAGVANPTSPSTTITATSTQTYRLTQTNLSTGCSNYKEVIVVVNPNTIQATAANTAVCPDVASTLPLNVISTGNYSYVWSPSLGLSNAFIANPTVTTNTAKTYTVTVTDNVSNCQLVKTVDVNINPAQACYPPVTLTGNVFHDANALTDASVNTTSAIAIPTGLYVTLVDANGLPVKTVAVNADGTYDFGITAPGNYSVVLNQTPGGSTIPSLPTGWANTGENLGAGAGNDATTNGILTGITIAGTNVTNANLGVQQPPVTTDKALPSQVNPGGIVTVDISNDFIKSDPDGTLSSITFTDFPDNVTTVTINGITYVPAGVTPTGSQQVWPGTLTVPITGLSVQIDPIDGGVTTSVPFKVTDNAGAESNVSEVTNPFTPIPAVTLSGNVFHDANALTDNIVNTTGTVTTIPTGLYVTLVDASGVAVKTVPVNADGTYDFGTTVPGTYSIVLHQTPTGSTTPDLLTGWLNTGENLGTTAGNDGTVNGILTNVVVNTTSVINANLGVQQPPVTTDKALPSQVNPGGTVTVDISNDFIKSDPDGTLSSITFTDFPDNVTTVTINGITYVPAGVTPTGSQQVWPGTLTVPVTGLSVQIDPIDGGVTTSVPFKVTDNAGAESNVSEVTNPFTPIPAVTLSGNVFHDANALTDNIVNTTGTVTTIPTGLYVTLVDASGVAVKTVPVNADGTYDFGTTVPGTYSIVLHQTPTGSTTPDLLTGWLNTGENLGTTAGNDGTVNGILTNVVVNTTSVINANLGVQQPPVTTDKALPSQVNPGGTVTVDISNDFIKSDPDGTLSSITFTDFPDNVTTVTINGITYVPAGVTPTGSQQVWPGTLTVPITGLSVQIDPIDGGVTTSVPFKVTDNAGAESNVSEVTNPFTPIPAVTLSGNVFHDANALTDNVVNTTGTVTTIPTGLFVTLVDASGVAVKTVPVNADGTYDFGTTVPGTYSVVLHQTSTGATTPGLPTGWLNTGENLGTTAGNDGTVNGILTNVVVNTTSVINANLGVQQPPVTNDKALPSQVNPGGIVTVDISNDFIKSDPDGTLTSITFTDFPDNVTTVTINGITYVPAGVTPTGSQQVWPGTLTVPITGLSVQIDPIDGGVTTSVPFKVTDNAGAESNVSEVTNPFTPIPAVTLSGNVFHDANALTDNVVNTTGTVTTIPTGLYVTLVDASGVAVKTVPVNADGTYDFGTTAPGTYSVVLHQTSTGSTTPGLPTGWLNTGENLGTTAGSDGTVNGILINVVVNTTSVINANLGIQIPPVSDPKTYVIDQPTTDQVITLNGTLVSTGTGTTSPGQLTGTDTEDGTLNGSGKNRTVVITELPDHGQLWYNGALVTKGQVIDNYDPALMTIKLTGTGYNALTFHYAYQDEAGIVSPPVRYTISWGSPLPVTLAYFDVTKEGQTAKMVWATTSETNSQVFAIERSLNARNWVQIGSQAAKGESTSLRKYSFVDPSPETGENLYRLKMIDKDGTYAYSRIRTASFDSKGVPVSIYPNPSSDKIYIKDIRISEIREVSIIDMNGHIVYSSQAVDSDGINVSKLPQGIYILRVKQINGTSSNHKIVIVR